MNIVLTPTPEANAKLQMQNSTKSRRFADIDARRCMRVCVSVRVCTIALEYQRCAHMRDADTIGTRRLVRSSEVYEDNNDRNRLKGLFAQQEHVLSVRLRRAYFE